MYIPASGIRDRKIPDRDVTTTQLDETRGGIRVISKAYEHPRNETELDSYQPQ